MKNFILFLLTVSIISCSKNTKQVQDEGPQFNLDSQEIKLSGVELSAIALKRAEPEQGPLIELFVDQPQNVAKSQRSIICGQYEIKGKTLFNHDPKIFAFKLSESEFNGVNSLPSNASCKLSLKLENKNGSTVRKEMPIKFQFDNAQGIEVSKYSAHKGLIAESMRLLPTDLLYLKNPFNYPVGIKYKAETQCYGYTAVTTVGLNNNHQMITGSPYTFYSNKIEVSGNYEKLEGDYSTFVNFVIPPGQVVQISTYSTMLGSAPNHQVLPSAMGTSIETKLYGAYIDHCVNHYEYPGLYLWNDLEKTSQDNSNPVKYTFPPGTIRIIPGLKPMPGR